MKLMFTFLRYMEIIGHPFSLSCVHYIEEERIRVYTTLHVKLKKSSQKIKAEHFGFNILKLLFLLFADEALVLHSNFVGKVIIQRSKS